MKVFNNNKLNNKLEKDGFVKLPFITEEEVAILKSFWNENQPKFFTGFHSTPFIKDYNYRLDTNEIIKKVFRNSTSKIISDDYTFLFGAYAVKNNDENSQWNLHQDWSFVNENKYNTFVIWVPLQDIKKENGWLGFVKGSHQFINNVRGTNTISEYAELTDKILEKYLTFVEIKAGEALVFYNNTLHYSSPNYSKNQRICANCQIYPTPAETIHYYRNQNWEKNKVEMFKFDENDILKFDFFDKDRPKDLQSLGCQTIEFNEVSPTKFDKLYKAHNQSFIKRLLSHKWKI